MFNAIAINGQSYNVSRAYAPHCLENFIAEFCANENQWSTREIPPPPDFVRVKGKIPGNLFSALFQLFQFGEDYVKSNSRNRLLRLAFANPYAAFTSIGARRMTAQSQELRRYFQSVIGFIISH